MSEKDVKKQEKQITWIDDTDKDDWMDVEYPGVYGQDDSKKEKDTDEK